MRTPLSYLAICTGLLLPISFLRSLRSLSRFEDVPTIASTYVFAIVLAAVIAILFFLAGMLVAGVVRLMSKKHLSGGRVRIVHNAMILLIVIGGVAGPLQYWASSLVGFSMLESGSFVTICVAVGIIALVVAFIRVGFERTQIAVERIAVRISEPAGCIGAGLVVGALAIIVVGAPRRSETAVGASVSNVADRPNIVLITMDTVSALHSNLYGHPLATTPNIVDFAAESVTFEKSYAACNFTTCSVASVQTGLHPWSHRVYSGNAYLRPEDAARSIAAQLHAAGYETAAFVANWWASPAHLVMDGEFDVRDDFVPAQFAQARLCRWAACDLDRLRGIFPMPIISRATLVYSKIRRTHSGSRYPYPPDVTYARAGEFLKTRDASRPLFLWVHTMAPHSPLLVDPPFRGKFLAGDLYASSADQVAAFTDGGEISDSAAHAFSLRYDELLLYADFHFGQFVEVLRNADLFDRSLVIVTSDHGESFERGYIGHAGPQLYENLLRVPLLIHAPGQRSPRRSASVASHVDLLPTILDYAHIAPTAHFDGRSLRPAIENETFMDRAAFAVNFEQNSSFAAITRGSIAAIDGRMKLIKHLKQSEFASDELFDIVSDPNETTNLLELRREDAERLNELVASQLRASASDERE